MGFTDFGFWLALLPVVALFHALPGRWRPAWLLAASLAYFTIESGAYVLLLLASVGWVWAAGHRIARAETDRARLIWLWAGLVPAAGVLVLFKLGDAMPGIAAPLGISYYTFRLIAYLVEVYWDERQLAPGWL
ncbi:MAG TPA: hypothetical protein VFF94_16640, partial [Novosphingobium sp.]|nr:hypothetical protein [Novosphingobium sp.]